MTHETVLIFDFGSQYAQLIARRVREAQVFAQIVRHDLPASRVRELNPKGIILSGGPASVYDERAPKCDPEIFNLNIPILGICYGMQLAASHWGGQVQPAASREFGRAELQRRSNAPLWREFPQHSTVWMSHGDQVTVLPECFEILAQTETCPHAAVRHHTQPFYGIQFHPEVSHTTYGQQLLTNFLKEICGCVGDWTMSTLIEESLNAIRTKVGSHRVICGLSGGVDSSVCAALLLKAIGPQVACIYIDNGLMRSGETEAVRRTFRDWFQADLHVVDARNQFLDALKGVKAPDEKRKRIGHIFIDVFKQEARAIENAHFLAQGTLYPDVIESGGSADGPAAMIKLHHNVGGLPQELGFELLEPLRSLFKDEVRKMGEQLGLPETVVWRHPFPGPGLAVRCIGEVTEERLTILRQADEIFIQELHASGYYRQTSQAFAVLLPISTIGVMGDGRTYESVVALRSVQSEDFMTADWSMLPHDLLARVANAIINRVRGVNRVVYDISSKPPATIEWE